MEYVNLLLLDDIYDFIDEVFDPSDKLTFATLVDNEKLENVHRVQKIETGDDGVTKYIIAEDGIRFTLDNFLLSKNPIAGVSAEALPKYEKKQAELAANGYDKRKNKRFTLEDELYCKAMEELEHADSEFYDLIDEAELSLLDPKIKEYEEWYDKASQNGLPCDESYEEPTALDDDLFIKDGEVVVRVGDITDKYKHEQSLWRFSIPKEIYEHPDKSKKVEYIESRIDDRFAYESDVEITTRIFCHAFFIRIATKVKVDDGFDHLFDDTIDDGFTYRKELKQRIKTYFNSQNTPITKHRIDHIAWYLSLLHPSSYDKLYEHIYLTPPYDMIRLDE